MPPSTAMASSGWTPSATRYSAPLWSMPTGIRGRMATGLHALSVALKLHRKGLRTVCVPKSVENEIACVPQAFGYNSVLSHTAESLELIRTGAMYVYRLAVVAVPAQHAR